ncbi:MAG: hypothetical protein H0W74_14225 [Sphingosinicella sp.]|nr:hypothetical protein [Sphingosinicella sp.]MBA3967113.1 hypothetical protein [Nitrospirales bacterium]
MKQIILNSIAMLTLATAQALGGEAAESPYCSEIKDWAPWAGLDLQTIDFPSNPLDPISIAVIEARVASGGKSQGYFLGTVYSGSACTRYAFDNLPFFSGISCVSAHGEIANSVGDDTEVQVYISPYEDPRRADRQEGDPLPALEDCQNWINAGTSNDGLIIRERRCRSSANPNIIILKRTVLARKRWFAANWKGIHNTQRTLMIAHVCGSAPILESMGGRVGFGLQLNSTPLSGALGSFEAIFDSMNGTGAYLSGDTPGTKRLAGDAATNTLLATMAGNPRTTLCPSVVHPAVINADGDPSASDPVYPLGTNAPSGEGVDITGHVTFDTIMNTSVPADTILTYNVLSGSITIKRNSIRWVGNRKIQFKYKNSTYGYSSGGSGQFHVEMRVNAQNARAANSNYPLGTGNKSLDGGDVGESRSGIHGVASNRDDFVWEFSRQ